MMSKLSPCASHLCCCSAPYIAFKTESSSDVGASSVTKKPAVTNTVVEEAAEANSTIQAKVLSSGSYIFYQDATASAIGIQSPARGASTFTAMSDCFLACDYDNTCAGVVVDSTVDFTARPKTCRLVKGSTQVGVFKRSMVRADINRLQPPAGLMQ